MLSAIVGKLNTSSVLQVFLWCPPKNKLKEDNNLTAIQ
uniref:Uncharacterized protein n=1 Tax=Arundo donax TaxID=35708 RepID=A0A0A9HU16_ARUDO